MIENIASPLEMPVDAVCRQSLMLNVRNILLGKIKSY
jgi:hypothetical protein